MLSRVNELVGEGLLDGARAALTEAGVGPDAVELVRVPGAFEIPYVARRLAASGRFDAVICLGCLIKGETMHFEYIASAVSQAIMDASRETGVPVTFGVLTTVTEQQAFARAVDGEANKGREAALAAAEMALLRRRLDAGLGHGG